MTKKQQSPAAYEDVRVIMNLATEKPGLKYVCRSAGMAINFKQRCNRYRNLLRDIEAERLMGIPGQRASTIYDTLVIRQVNDAGEPDRRGCVILFEHHVVEGQIIDPETGEEINFNSLVARTLFDE